MSKVGEVNKLKVADVSEVVEGIGKEVVIEGHSIALFKLKSGKIKAIENSCPHKGGPLSQGIVSGDNVFCPLHDWKVCVNDGMVQGPDEGCVQTYKVDVDDDSVYLYI
ncbi:nitrite reductase small subunit NirD [Bacillus sp. FJAT-44742]|uniref:nitrite reductase small subunit NirD n=1 Tax=Bacillus sp. FJAT-44742 TaxID=2014005 RepID=UPI000C237CAA|nr:nitrite reductase small subunit NirD [Bacillus sp. FJAT-44742]